MKAVFLFLSTLFITFLSAQQQLAYKIPANVDAVVSAKGSKFLDNISYDEFNRTKIGKKVLGDLFEGDKENQDIRNLGIDFSSDLYYFNQITDSILYNCFLFPLSNSAKFEELLKLKDKNIEDIKYKGAVRELYGDKTIMLWDNEKLLVVFGEIKRKFLQDSIKAAYYGVKDDVSTYDFYYPEDSVVMKKHTRPYYESDSVAVVDDEAFTIPMPRNTSAKNEETVPVIETDTDEYDSYEDATTPTYSDDDYYDREYREYYDSEAYNEAVKEREEVKERILQKWMSEYAYVIFNKNQSTPSIIDNPTYQKSLDKNAAVTFFTNIPKMDYSDYLDYPSYMFPYYFLFFSQSYVYGGKNLNGQLYINKKDVRFTTRLEVDEKDAELYKEMYNHKLNKNFYNYINKDKLIGFISTSFNTEKYLELYPRWIANMYGGVESRYADEAQLMAEFFTLLLDEKAVAKVVKGDALFLFNGISTKESTYKTYEYDDDYNATEVEKTKKESVPEFLFMSSSDDTRIIESVLRYGIKKEWVKFNNGIYTMDGSEIKPVVLHLLIKDGIVFLGTSYEDLYKIKNNTYVAKIDKKQKEILSKNNASLFFEPKNLVNQVPKEEFDDIQKFMKIRNLLNGMGTMYGKSTGIKGNSISGEAVMETTEEDENSLKYFLRFTELLSEF